MLLKNISKRLIVVEDKKIIPGYLCCSSGCN